MDTNSSGKLSAGIFGLFYGLLGLAGLFVTGFTGSGKLIIFDLSPLHNIVHLVIGAFGLAAFAMGVAMSKTFCQVVGVILALIAVLGIIVPNPFNVLPIGGANVILHAATALVLLFIGFSGEPARADR